MFSQISFLFQMPKRDYDYAQGDFDFGQVHVIWWLSYCQVGEKVSVEPCIVSVFLPNIMIIGWIFLTWDQFFLSYANLPRLPLYK